MKKFNFYSDAGHGWLAVDTSDLEAIGLTVQEFSPYSYRQGDTLYLEEDCDASFFVKQYESRIGKFECEEFDHGNYSPIRHMDRLPAETADYSWF